MVEFDPVTGQLILSSKQKEVIEKRKKSIILTKGQEYNRNPAVAWLKIELGPELKPNNEFLIKEIYDFCEDYSAHRYRSVEVYIKLIENEKIMIEARTSKMMYSFFKDLIEDITRKCQGSYNAVIEGHFNDKGDFQIKNYSSNA